jgi:uncharacterized protein (TIGR02466 family)
MEDTIKAEIHSIFPTPIYLTSLNREFTKSELSFVDDTKSKTKENFGNIISKDSYILNQKKLSNIKEQLDLIIKDYFDKVISCSENTKPYITQSWINYTEANQFHHRHNHPQSLVSGVLYINADKDNDKIKFFKSEYEFFRPEYKEFNLFNSSSWWFGVKTGDVILFPSSLTHDVEIKKGDNTRISLAFNVFVKGTIGEKEKISELIL